MRPRRLWHLLQWLPSDAALWRSIDPDAASWGTDRELLAALIERVDLVAATVHNLTGLTLRVHSGRRQRWPRWEPLRVPRPGEVSPEPETISPKALAGMFRRR